MPKQKTHKGMAKRFKVTASGKATKRSPSRGHLQSGKTPKRKRQLRTGAILTGIQAKKILDALRPGL
jgi:large subunit ribosomal protein L35